MVAINVSAMAGGSTEERRSADPITDRGGHGGIAALCLVARMHHVAADPGTLAHQMGLQPSEVPTLQDLVRAAKHIGLKAKISVTTPDRLALSPLPALAMVRNAAGEVRAIVLAQCNGQRVLLQDPSAGPGGNRPPSNPWKTSPRSGPASCC